MKKAMIIIVLLLLVSACTGDQSSIKPLTDKEVQSIHVPDYFPNQAGTTREYHTLDRKGNVISRTSEVVESYGKGQFAVKGSMQMAGEANTSIDVVKVYQVTDNSVTIVDSQNTALNLEGSQRVQLTTSPSWGLNQEETRYITGLGKRVETSAGVFTDCIEVTDILENEDNTSSYRTYFAPHIGEVLSLVKFSDMRDFVVFTELADYHIPTDRDSLESEGSSEDLESNPTGENGATPEISVGFIQDGVYFNEDLGISFSIPHEWTSFLSLDHRNRIDESTAVYTIDFIYSPEPEIEQYLFNIHVYEQKIQQADWEYPELTYLGTNNGRTYAYSVATEPSHVLLKPENKEYLDKVSQMVSELPSVMKTFTFSK